MKGGFFGFSFESKYFKIVPYTIGIIIVICSFIIFHKDHNIVPIEATITSIDNGKKNKCSCDHTVITTYNIYGNSSQIYNKCNCTLTVKVNNNHTSSIEKSKSYQIKIVDSNDDYEIGQKIMVYFDNDEIKIYLSSYWYILLIFGLLIIFVTYISKLTVSYNLLSPYNYSPIFTSVSSYSD
jgi:hypothetical protein